MQVGSWSGRVPAERSRDHVLARVGGLIHEQHGPFRGGAWGTRPCLYGGAARVVQQKAEPPSWLMESLG